MLLTVILDVTLRAVILTLHGGHVLHPHHVVLRVGVDNLILNLLLAGHGGLHMDGHILLCATDAACHRGHASRLQSLHHSHTSDAVGCQSLLVHIDGDLFLQVAIQHHIAHRRDAAQTVGQVIAVLLQFPRAPVFALDGDEQGRGTAKVVVHSQSQHTAWQTLTLEGVESMLDFRPHLILVVHTVLQFHLAHTHPIAARRGGL